MSALAVASCRMDCCGEIVRVGSFAAFGSRKSRMARKQPSPSPSQPKTRVRHARTAGLTPIRPDWYCRAIITASSGSARYALFQGILHLSRGKTWSALFLRPGFLCDEYLMATTLAWTGPYRAQLNIKPGFFKPIRECLVCRGRPDCDYALGPEFFVYAV
jgi:hypothetical protein